LAAKSKSHPKVRRAWQNAGYFAAQVHADARVLTSGPSSGRIAVTVQLDEGPQYRLEEIRFRNNVCIPNAKALRDLFPIKDGDIFSRDAIENGMRDLHRAYGEYGFISLSAVPAIQIHEEQMTVSLDIDLDEGRQFLISRVDVVGVDETALESLRRERMLATGTNPQAG
jgi:outer membrane protein insertion porin family